VAIQILGNDGNALTSRDVDGSAANFVYVTGQLKFSGSYTSGGDTLDWTTVADKLCSSQCLNLFLDWQGLGNCYWPIGQATTALNGWKVKVGTVGTYGTEHGATAYEAAITGDLVTFTACFRKLL
jgi:hypothetical protein